MTEDLTSKSKHLAAIDEPTPHPPHLQPPPTYTTPTSPTCPTRGCSDAWVCGCAVGTDGKGVEETHQENMRTRRARRTEERLSRARPSTSADWGWLPDEVTTHIILECAPLPLLPSLARVSTSFYRLVSPRLHPLHELRETYDFTREECLGPTTDIRAHRPRDGLPLAMCIRAAALVGAFSHILNLHFESSDLGNKGACALAEAFSRGGFPQLEVLWLFNNGICAEGAVALADALTPSLRYPSRGCSLRTLSISANRIGDEGMAQLSQRLLGGALPSVSSLYIWSNLVGDSGMRALANALAKGALPFILSLDIGFDNPGNVEPLQIEMQKRRAARLLVDPEEDLPHPLPDLQ
jgi:hypothetical protein